MRGEDPPSVCRQIPSSWLEAWLEPKGRRINSLLLTEWNIFLLLLGDRTPKLPAFGLGICISRYLGSQAFSWPQTKRYVLCVFGCLVFRVRPCCVTVFPIKNPLFLPACLSPDYLLFLIKFLSTVCRSIINLLTILTQILVCSPPQMVYSFYFLTKFFLVLLVRKSSWWICVTFWQVSMGFVWFQ